MASLPRIRRATDAATPVERVKSGGGRRASSSTPLHNTEALTSGTLPSLAACSAPREVAWGTPDPDHAGEWVEAQDDDGNTYYFNTASGESRWEAPPEWSGAHYGGLQPSPVALVGSGGAAWGGGAEAEWPEWQQWEEEEPPPAAAVEFDEGELDEEWAKLIEANAAYNELLEAEAEAEAEAGDTEGWGNGGQWAADGEWAPREVHWTFLEDAEEAGFEAEYAGGEVVQEGGDDYSGWFFDAPVRRDGDWESYTAANGMEAWHNVVTGETWQEEHVSHLALLSRNPYLPGAPHPLAVCGMWTCYHDEESDMVYYLHADGERESTWEVPPEWDPSEVVVPPLTVLAGDDGVAYTVYRDAATMTQYFVSQADPSDVRWCPPPSVAHVAVEGDGAYIKADRCLARVAEWELYTDDQNGVWYYNTETGGTQWEAPEAVVNASEEDFAVVDAALPSHDPTVVFAGSLEEAAAIRIQSQVRRRAAVKAVETMRQVTPAEPAPPAVDDESFSLGSDDIDLDAIAEAAAASFDINDLDFSDLDQAAEEAVEELLGDMDFDAMSEGEPSAAVLSPAATSVSSATSGRQVASPQLPPVMLLNGDQPVQSSHSASSPLAIVKERPAVAASVEVKPPPSAGKTAPPRPAVALVPSDAEPVAAVISTNSMLQPAATPPIRPAVALVAGDGPPTTPKKPATSSKPSPSRPAVALVADHTPSVAGRKSSPSPPRPAVALTAEDTTPTESLVTPSAGSKRPAVQPTSKPSPSRPAIALVAADPPTAAPKSAAAKPPAQAKPAPSTASSTSSPAPPAAAAAKPAPSTTSTAPAPAPPAAARTPAAGPPVAKAVASGSGMAAAPGGAPWLKARPTSHAAPFLKPPTSGPPSAGKGSLLPASLANKLAALGVRQQAPAPKQARLSTSGPPPAAKAPPADTPPPSTSTPSPAPTPAAPPSTTPTVVQAVVIAPPRAAPPKRPPKEKLSDSDYDALGSIFGFSSMATARRKPFFVPKPKPTPAPEPAPAPEPTPEPAPQPLKADNDWIRQRIEQVKAGGEDSGQPTAPPAQEATPAGKEDNAEKGKTEEKEQKPEPEDTPLEEDVGDVEGLAAVLGCPVSVIATKLKGVKGKPEMRLIMLADDMFAKMKAEIEVEEEATKDTTGKSALDVMRAKFDLKNKKAVLMKLARWRRQEADMREQLRLERENRRREEAAEAAVAAKRRREEYLRRAREGKLRKDGIMQNVLDGKKSAAAAEKSRLAAQLAEVEAKREAELLERRAAARAARQARARGKGSVNALKKSAGHSRTSSTGALPAVKLQPQRSGSRRTSLPSLT